MKTTEKAEIPVGTKAFILSKLYYGVLSKNLEEIEIERYYSILYFVLCNPGCTQQNICNNLAIDKTAMVKIINYLIKIGFVERTKNPDDRREHFITLTKKGNKQTQEIARAFKALDKEIFLNVQGSEKEIFLAVLAKISSNLNDLPSNTLSFNYTKQSTPKNNRKQTKPDETT